MEEAKQIVFRLHKLELITDEELDILLQAINIGNGMFHYPMPDPYPNECPCRPIGDNIMYKNPLENKFGDIY